MPNFDATPYTQLTTPARNDVQGVVKDVSEALPENQTKYALLEDLLKFGSWASKVRTVTASGTVTLADTDPIFIEIDPDGADRDVSFPAKGDDNHGYYIRNVGSANVLTLKRSGGAEITTLEAGEAKYIMPSTISDFASLAGSSSSSSGIGGLTIASAAVTGSNVTGVEGTLHNLDLSGLTANRDFNLPTPSAADKLCGVRVSTGDASYALIVKVNLTEVARSFITNEILVFQSTGTGAGDWVLTQNGTIGCLAVLERTTAQSIASSSITQKVQFNSAPVDQGGMADVATNFRVNIRRSGTYEVSAYASLPGVDDTENMQARIYIDGAFVDYGVTYSPSADKALCSQVVKKYALTVGQYVEMYIFHTEGASQNTDTTYKPQLSVEETNGTGGTSGVGGGSLSDGDYGDITVGGAGTTMTINVAQLPLSYLDVDVALAANSDVKVASQKAVKTYIDAAVTGLLDFKGSTDCSANPNYPSASKGDAYIVTVAGKIGGASGKSVDVGDVYLATADNAGGTEASVGTSWVVLEHNLTGALLAANNLSDLANAATALTNLGLSANGIALVTAADYAAMRKLLKIGSLQDAPNTSVSFASTSYVDILSKTITVAAGDTIEVILKGELLNNSGGTRTPSYKLDINGVSVEFADTTLANSAAARVLLELRGTISVLSTSDVKLQLRESRSAGAAANTVTSTDNRRMAWNTSSSDVTGSVTIKLQMLSDSESATQTCYVNAWEIRVLNTSP